MNIFRTLRNHMVASGVLFTDQQMVDAVSKLYSQMEMAWKNFRTLEQKVVALEEADNQIRDDIKHDRRMNRDFERDFRELEHEYHDLVRYCLRLEERIKNAEALLVSLTNPTNKKQ